MISRFVMALGAICTIYGLYYACIAVVGNLKRPKYNPQAEPRFRIAALIPARNEEAVVPLLIDSLKKQRYPQELFDIYVIPNNCDDDTRGAALRAGAKVLDCDLDVHSKGEVLRFAFGKLLQEQAQYDAFCIFDADNIVDGGFLQAANNALAAGYEIAQGYRDSKNPNDSWAAGCTSVFFWFMNRLYNHARFALGISASLNGTGILIGADLVRRMGWNTHTLTEDLEYTAQCAIREVKIGWMEDAVTYDEQPLTLKDSFTQRRRWAAGSFQCFKRYNKALLCRAIKKRKLDALDIGTLFCGMPIQLLGLISFLLMAADCIVHIAENPAAGLLYAAVMAGLGVGGMFLGGAAFVLLVCLLEHKMCKERALNMLTMGWYLFTWMPANVLCFFTRPPKWTYIPHVRNVGIDERETEQPAKTPRIDYKPKETEAL